MRLPFAAVLVAVLGLAACSAENLTNASLTTVAVAPDRASYHPGDTVQAQITALRGLDVAFCDLRLERRVEEQWAEVTVPVTDPPTPGPPCTISHLVAGTRLQVPVPLRADLPSGAYRLALGTAGKGPATSAGFTLTTP